MSSGGAEYRAYMQEKQALLREIQRLRASAVKSQEDVNTSILDYRIKSTTRMCVLYMRNYTQRTLGVAFRKWALFLACAQFMFPNAKQAKRSKTPHASGSPGIMARMFSSSGGGGANASATSQGQGQKSGTMSEVMRMFSKKKVDKRRSSIRNPMNDISLRREGTAQRRASVKYSDGHIAGAGAFGPPRRGSMKKEKPPHEVVFKAPVSVSHFFGENELPATPRVPLDPKHSDGVLVDVFRSAAKKEEQEQEQEQDHGQLELDDLGSALDDLLLFEGANDDDYHALGAIKAKMGLRASVPRKHSHFMEETESSHAHFVKSPTPARSRSADASMRRDRSGFNIYGDDHHAPGSAYRPSRNHLSPTSAHRSRERHQAQATRDFNSTNGRIGKPFHASRSATTRHSPSRVRQQQVISPSSSLLGTTASRYHSRKKNSWDPPLNATKPLRGHISPERNTYRRPGRNVQYQLILGQLSPTGKPSPLRSYVTKGGSFLV